VSEEKETTYYQPMLPGMSSAIARATALAEEAKQGKSVEAEAVVKAIREKLPHLDANWKINNNNRVEITVSLK